MEGREDQHHQPLKLCPLLYTFFKKFFARKTPTAVALKSGTPNDCIEVPIYDSSPPRISSTTQIDPFATLEQINGWQNSYPGIAINGSAREKDKEEEEEAKAPKKTVSFNENVEDINSITKQRTESKSEQEQDDRHHPKRLRSILRDGSGQLDFAVYS